MKKIVIVILAVIFSGCTCSKKVSNDPNVYFIENEADVTQLLKKETETSSENQQSLLSNKTISFAKKEYHFHSQTAFVKELYISNHDQDNPKKVTFYLENIENLTIDGNGSRFVFHGTMIPFVFKNCKNITLKNVSIDFEIPHLRQLTILSVDKENNTSTAEIHPSGNYKIENDKLILVGEDYSITPEWLMGFRPDKRLTYQRRDIDFNVKKVSEIAPNTIKIEGWSQNALTQVGERFALRSYNRPTPSIVIDYCKDTHIENVIVHYAWGMGLLAQMSENIYLNKFQVALYEKDTRFYTTQADATHFSACKGIIKSENGLYEAMADDAINVHGTYLKVIERTSPTTIKAQYMHPQAWGFLWGEVGDEVQFVKSNTMELVGEKIYKIASISAVDKPTEFGAKVFEISFTEAIPLEITENEPYGVENLTWTPEVIFKNNIVRNNRARGALFSTPKKVVCQDNLFDHTHGTAILLCGDCNGWYETGACTEVIIRNNKFINSLTANYQFTNAIISIYPEIPNLEKQQKYFHSGIVIEDNVFETFDEPILYAKSVDGLIFQNNKIIKNTEFPPFHWNKQPFFFEKVKNVKITKNQFENPLTSQQIKLNFTNKSEVIFE